MDEFLGGYVRLSKSLKLRALELDEKQGLLDAESKEELYNLRMEIESAEYDWADQANDYARDEKRAEND